MMSFLIGIAICLMVVSAAAMFLFVPMPKINTLGLLHIIGLAALGAGIFIAAVFSALYIVEYFSDPDFFLAAVLIIIFWLMPLVAYRYTSSLAVMIRVFILQVCLLILAWFALPLLMMFYESLILY